MQTAPNSARARQSADTAARAMSHARPARVLIADDHPLIVVGLTTALGDLGIEVVDHVETAGEVVRKYEEVAPDVLILDIRFGEGPTGLDVARELLQKFPDARIVFYSQFDQDETISEAYRLGGAAFIPKNTAPALLAEAVMRVNDGHTYFLKDIAERLALIGVRRDESPQSRLEARELEVFKLMALGLTNAEIAEKMHLSPKTISTTSQTVKEKLGVQRQADITKLAVKHLLISI
jgi:two-component system invasion response regulator UvrY